MKTFSLCAIVLLLASPLLAQDGTPKDQVAKAAKLLASKNSYSWKSTFTVPAATPMKPGPTEGKIEKDKGTLIKFDFFGKEITSITKGEKGALKAGPNWKSFEDQGAEGEPMAVFLYVTVKNQMLPAAEAAQLLGFCTELKKEGDMYSSDLTEAGAKAKLSMKLPDGNVPTVNDAKASVKFYLKDGLLTKYELKMRGKVDYFGEPVATDRVQLTEIKDIDSTQVEIPDAAKKSL
jgi:hypothetical protein